MTSVVQKIRQIAIRHTLLLLSRHITGPGSGVGKGGGGGGTVREAGGAFGVMEAAREGQYFYKKNKEELLKLKKHLDEQVAFHEEAIKRHTEAIKTSKQHADNLEEHTRKHH